MFTYFQIYFVGICPFNIILLIGTVILKWCAISLEKAQAVAVLPMHRVILIEENFLMCETK